jgi:hypothetical protein
MDESLERMAIRLYQRLEKEEKFLLILDDVWEEIAEAIAKRSMLWIAFDNHRHGNCYERKDYGLAMEICLK